jgi:putative glutamine amidotransferase
VTTKPRILISPWLRNVSTTFEGTTLDLLTIAPSYTNAIVRCGGIPVVAALCELEDIPRLFEGMDGLILSGGRDMDPDLYGQENTDSERALRELDEFDMALMGEAIRQKVPILGICRGIQVANVARGGDLHQEVLAEGSVAHPTYPEMLAGDGPRAHRHEVALAAGSRLAAMYGDVDSITVNSLHHQAVGRVADGTTVTATASDGTVEAIEDPAIELIAVQWHPEQLPASGGDVLFADLVERACARATMTP